MIRKFQDLSCKKAGFFHENGVYRQMPAKRQFFRPNWLNNGGLIRNACAFAGISAKQGGKGDNSCFFAGLMLRPKILAIPYQYLQQLQVYI
ncbi:hypothetical protein [Paenibacillus whitsoniae]|uniref:Uncharacterized protein n=1 Tax=Paenibacillus whitsoniae TaxID=2496558 RepID=A0A430J6K1_9BACL|nr:hypothetical protein [Paenibacillus whitsoniae]RTE04373.1 hypothetical protein EJQ19_26435 [Paenibacillus whitsoniae]